MEEVSIAASVTSIIVAAVAVMLAAYFFNQAKNTERDVAVSLSKIETQGDSLQKLTGRWMDRLTKYATEAKPPDETVLMLVKTITQIPSIATQLQSPTAGGSQGAAHAETVTELQSPTAGQSGDAAYAEAVVGYITAHYYAAMLNVTLQAVLVDDKYNSNETLRGLVDRSYTDFVYLEGEIDKVDEDVLKASRVHRFYVDTATRKDSVRNLAMFDAAFQEASQ